MKKVFFITFALITYLLFLINIVQAVPANPKNIVNITQPNGDSFQAVYVGDEQTGHVETLEGYTIIKDKENWWNYAEKDDSGNLKPNTRLIKNKGTSKMSVLGVPRQIEKHLYSEKKENNVTRTDISNNLAVSQKTTGEIRVLVLLIEFQDVKHLSPYTPSYYNEVLFSRSSGANSMHNYYKEASYGQLSLVGDISPWYTAKYNLWNYSDRCWDFGYDCLGNYELYSEAMKLAENDFNFSNYDYDGDGIPDHIIVITAATDWGDVWPHYGGHIMMTENEPMGVYAHEFGHSLGAPDLYDYDTYGDDPTNNVQYPVNSWDLMASGSWGNGGNTPVHPSGYIKWKYFNWLNPINITYPQTTNIGNFESLSGNKLYVVKIPDRNQYFLVENRQQIGYDTYLPESGIIVYHVDEDMWSNNGPPNYPNFEIEVEDPTLNTYRTGAAFSKNDGQTEFSSRTTLNSNSNEGTPSYVSIYNIGNEGNSMQVSFSVNSQLVDIYNDGGSTLSVSDISGPSWISVEPKTFNIAPNSFKVVDTRFDNSISPGYYTSDLKVYSNDPVENTASIPISLNLSKNNAPSIYPPFWGVWTYANSPVTLNLSAHEKDAEDLSNKLSWSVSDVNTSLMSVNIDKDTHILTVNPVLNKYGKDKIMLALTDSGGKTDISFLQVHIQLYDDTMKPSIYLNSPWNGSLITDKNQVFEYRVYDDSNIKSCSLVINDVIIQTKFNITQSKINRFATQLTNGNYLWRVECFDDSINNNKGISDTRQVNINLSSANILLVDDDAGQDFEYQYMWTLWDSFHYWDINTMGNPKYSDMENYSIVIWFTADALTKTLTKEDENEIKNYLDNGGNLLFSSQDYLSEIYGPISTNTKPGDFARDYLYVDHITPNVNLNNVNGVLGDEITDSFGTINLSFEFEDFSDRIIPKEGADKILESNYEATALKVDDGTFKVVFLAFPFEAIEDWSNKNILMNNIIYWFKSSEIKCYLDSDCGSSGVVNYCSDSYSCANNTSWTCINPGTRKSKCVKSSIDVGCEYCQDNCLNETGLCLFKPKYEIQIISPEERVYNKTSQRLEVQLSSSCDLSYSDNILNYWDIVSNWENYSFPSDGRYSTLCTQCLFYNKSKTFRDGFHYLSIKCKNKPEINSSRVFLIDSTKPRISTTKPSSGKYTNGSGFYIKYTEEYPIMLLLNVSSKTVQKSGPFIEDSNTCPAGRNKECFFNINLSEFDGQEVNYSFMIADFSGKIVKSKITKIKVDTTPPVLNNPDTFWHKEGKYIYFDLDITEKNFDEVTYSYTDSKGRLKEKSLCSSLKDGRCTKKKSISLGDHDFSVIIIDKAGNSKPYILPISA